MLLWTHELGKWVTQFFSCNCICCVPSFFLYYFLKRFYWSVYLVPVLLMMYPEDNPIITPLSCISILLRHKNNTHFCFALLYTFEGFSSIISQGWSEENLLRNEHFQEAQQGHKERSYSCQTKRVKQTCRSCKGSATQQFSEGTCPLVRHLWMCWKREMLKDEAGMWGRAILILNVCCASQLLKCWQYFGWRLAKGTGDSTYLNGYDKQ